MTNKSSHLTTVVIAPDFYLASAPSYRWSFPILRLALIYDRIVLGVEPWRFDVLPSGWRSRESDYEGVVRHLCAVEEIDWSLFPLGFQSGVERSRELATSYYQHVLPPLLKYSSDRGSDLLVSHHFFDDYVRVAQAVSPGSRNALKKTRLRWEVLNHVIDRYIPGFRPVDIREVDRAKSFKRSFSQGVERLVSGWRSSTLTLEITDHINRKIASESRKLDQILETDQVGRLLPDAKSLLKGALSYALDEVVPLSGAVIGGIEKVLNLRAVKRDHLDFTVSIAVYRALFSGPPTHEAECTICALTVGEIEDLTDEQAKSLLPPTCVRHMVAYLNCRKPIALVGRELLLCMKRLAP